MKTISIINIVESTSVDGEGLRTTVYAAGCGHHCPGCHNPQSWEIEAGIATPVDELALRLIYGNHENITFSGGDPFFQAEAFGELAERIKQESDKTIWCYTGYMFEELIHKERFAHLLHNIDILVDGRFVIAERDESLLFRGSRNQRIIDVSQSLASGKVILHPVHTTSPLLDGIKQYQ